MKKSKTMEGISEMFLISKRIYLNLIKNIEEPNQLNRVEDLNAETNYLEKALRFYRLKSFNSQPREEGKGSSSSSGGINDTHSTVGNNTHEGQEEQDETIVNAPPPIVTQQKASSAATTSAPPFDEQNAISPINDFSLLQQQGTREAISSQTEKDRVKFHINRTINEMLDSFSLKCPLCKNGTNFKKAGFFTRHVHEKHDYRLNANEQRMIRENLEKISHKQQEGHKKKVLPNLSFLQDHRQDMMELNRAGKRSVFDEEPEEMGTQVKLRKLGQEEIDKQIKGKKLPKFKTNRRRNKKSFTPIPPDKWERIERRRAGKRKREEEEEEEEAYGKLRKLGPRVNFKTNRGKNKKLFTPIPPDRWERIERRRAVKRRRRKEDEEEEDDVVDAKIIKLDPTVNLKKLSLHLPPTLRGKRRRRKEDDEDEDVIVKKKRKMSRKKTIPVVKMKKLKAGDENIKLLRQPVVRLNRVAKNPFYAKINSVDKKDEKLRMTPTVRLNREDFKLSRMTPKVKIKKLKAGDENIKLLHQPVVRLNRVAKNPFYVKINSVDKKDEKLRMTPTVRLNREDFKLSRMTPKVKIKRLKAGDKNIKLLHQPTVRLTREDFKLSRMTPKVKIKKLKAGDEDIKLLRQPVVRLNRVAKNPFYAKIKSESLYKKFPALKRIV